MRHEPFLSRPGSIENSTLNHVSRNSATSSESTSRPAIAEPAGSSFRVNNFDLRASWRRSLYEIGVVLISALAVGAMSWKFVEEPFLRKKRPRAIQPLMKLSRLPFKKLRRLSFKKFRRPPVNQALCWALEFKAFEETRRSFQPKWRQALPVPAQRSIHPFHIT
jgi:hypothetical protein